MYNESITHIKCNGPLFQNINTNSIIVIDAHNVKIRGEGSHCYSAGKFENYIDRKVTINDIVIPITVFKWQSLDRLDLPWEGDLFEAMNFINNDIMVDISLAFKEENRLNAEIIFDQILYTFKFL